MPKPLPPAEFLRRILTLHNYDAQPVSSLATSADFYHRKPTAAQIAAYDMEIVRAVRSSELGRLVELRAEGKSMDACNRFGESVLHMACRRGAAPTVRFLLDDCGLPVNISDDFGRTPMHDACWTATPSFEVVAQLLDRDRHLVLVADSRASLPMTYIHEEQWGDWCAFLFDRRNAWWAAATHASWNDHLRRSRASKAASAAAAAGKAGEAAMAPPPLDGPQAMHVNAGGGAAPSSSKLGTSGSSLAPMQMSPGPGVAAVAATASSGPVPGSAAATAVP